MSVEIGQIVKGIVINIKNYGVFFQLENDKIGFCHISNVSDAFVSNLNSIFKLKSEYKVKVIEYVDDNKVNVSIKACEENKNIIEHKPKRDRDSSESIKFKSKKQSNINTYDKSKPSFDDLLQKYLKNSDDNLRAINARNKKHTKR